VILRFSAVSQTMAFSTDSMSTPVFFCNKESGLNIGVLQTIAIFTCSMSATVFFCDHERASKQSNSKLSSKSEDNCKNVHHGSEIERKREIPMIRSLSMDDKTIPTVELTARL
jgi:hypothetical protein